MDMDDNRFISPSASIENIQEEKESHEN